MSSQRPNSRKAGTRRTPDAKTLRQLSEEVAGVHRDQENPKQRQNLVKTRQTPSDRDTASQRKSEETHLRAASICYHDPRGLPIGGDIGSGQRRPGEHHIKERRRNPAAERAEPSTAHQRNAPEVPTSSPPAGRALRRAYAARDSIFWSGIVRRAPSTRSCPYYIR